MKMRKLKRGFTLVELVVVIAVIAILAAVSVGAYFGVTDSANSSNATQGIKQIKDLWTMYSVSDYEDFSDVEERAQDFCLRYAADNGPNYNVNYDIVTIKAVGSSAYGDNRNEKGILFKVETNYPTWFLVNDQHIVEESTSMNKNNEDFNNSLLTSQRLELRDEVTNGIAEDAAKYEYPFKIQSLGKDTNGNEVRGFGYYKIDLTYINESSETSLETITMKPGEKLSDKDDRLVTTTIVNASDFGSSNLYEVFLTSDNSLLDTNTELYIDNKDIIDRSLDAVPGKNYSYYINQQYGVTSKMILSGSINLENYEVCLVLKQSTNEIYFSHNLADAITKIKESNAQQNFIFLNNYTIDTKYDVPDNTVMVIDYLVSASDISTYTSSLMDYNRAKDLAYNNVDQKRILEASKTYNKNDNIQEPGSSGCYINTINITDKGILNFNGNSFLMIEGKLSPAAGGVKIGVGSRGVINNGGTINLNNSYLRCLGQVLGGGTINATGTSKIIEVFKPNDYKGGAYTANLIANTNATNGVERPVFPFMDYQIDNLQCKTIINYGSYLEAITLIDLFGLFISDPIVLISPDATSNPSLFKIQSQIVDGVETSKIEKIYDSINKKTNLNVFGKITDSEFKMQIDIETMLTNFVNSNILAKIMKYIIGDVFSNGKISSTDFNFPISNLNINVCSSSEISLDESNTRYEVLPTSSINIEGKLIVGSNTKLVLLTPKDFSEILSNNSFNEMNHKEQVEYFASLDTEKKLLTIQDNGECIVKGSLYTNNPADCISKTTSDSLKIENTNSGTYSFKIVTESTASKLYLNFKFILDADSLLDRLGKKGIINIGQYNIEKYIG